MGPDTSGGGVAKIWESRGRTSSQVAVAKSDEDDIMSTVDSRVLEILRTPGTAGKTGRSEPLQVLRYLPKQKYDVHSDYMDPSQYDQASGVFADMSSVVEGGRNRLATVIWYASSPESGGETHFPRAGGLPEHEDVSVNCAGAQAGNGLKVPARRRQATLFYNLRPDGAVDPFTLHAGCPPSGAAVKWACNQWIWNRDLDSEWEQSVAKLQQRIATQGYT